MTGSDQARVAYELSLLTSLGEAVDTLLEAFFRHPDHLRHIVATVRLGKDIPWVLAACDGGTLDATGLVVGGAWNGKRWDFDAGFTLFTCERMPAGEFVEMAPGKGRVRVQGTLPGTGPLRPDMKALQAEIARATARWSRRADLVQEWLFETGACEYAAFPQTFVELRFAADCYRGLVIGGEKDREGRWDYGGIVTLFLPDGRIVDLDAAQADMVEELVYGRHADLSR